MKFGQATSGVGTATTFNLTWLPQYIHWVNSTTPQGLKITVLGDGVVLDLDAKGIASMNLPRGNTVVTNSFTIPCADGFVGNKNVEIVFTNGVAAAIDLYGFSTQKGNYYLQTVRQKVFASSGAVFEKFAMLGMPDVASGDIMQISYVDGHVQKIDNVDVLALQSTQNPNANLTNCKFIDNFDSFIDNVNVIPAADQTYFVSRWVKIGGTNAAPIQEQ